MKTKDQLIRIVKTPDGRAELDLSFKKNGRGAYVCKNSECLDRAVKAKRFERSLSAEIPTEVYSACEEVILKNE